jgi:hypothetical protein
MRFPSSIFPCLILTAAIAGNLPAQTTVVVRVSADGMPQQGVLVTAVDSTGAFIRSVLTAASGEARLQIAPGRIRLRAELIGRQATQSDWITVRADSTVLHSLELLAAPVALDAIEVEGEQRCTERPLAGVDVHTVWDEARKALEIERVGRLTTAYRFDIESYTRELDPQARTVMSYESRRQSGIFSNPFRSLPPAQLASDGYHRRTTADDVLYAPTPDVLLSDAFLDSHCFNLTRDVANRPGQIGLAFEPLPGPNADVTGVLWLHDESAELRELEYRYERLPRGLPAGPYGGRASFQRLPNGGWIVRDWRIRSPIVGVSEQRVLGERREVEQLIGLYEEGAEVVRVSTQAGTVIEDRERATLAGRVAEDSRGSAVDGARVRLLGTELNGSTDASGNFRIAGVPEGTYRVVIDHPRLDEAGFVPDTLTVDLTNGETAALSATLPSLDAFLADQRGPAWQDSLAALGRLLGRPDLGVTVQASAEPSAAGTARVHGRILSHETGRALEGVLVRIEGTTSSAVTTASGRFVLRDVPPGERRLVAEMLGYETFEHAIELASNQAVETEFRMATRPVELEPIEVAVRSPFLEGHGFYERRDMSVTGRFITRADIERRAPTEFSDLLRDISFVHLLYGGPGERPIRFNRHVRWGLGGQINDRGCEPGVWLDGRRYRDVILTSAQWGDHSEVEDINIVPPPAIEAVEIYAGNAPLQYLHPCGSILIWTRRGG